MTKTSRSGKDIMVLLGKLLGGITVLVLAAAGVLEASHRAKRSSENGTPASGSIIFKPEIRDLGNPKVTTIVNVTDARYRPDFALNSKTPINATASHDLVSRLTA